MSQEEETSTLAGAFTGLEHLISVEVRRETFLEHLKCQVIKFEQLAKLVKSVISDCCLTLHLDSFVFG